jgi:hypothetical protein
VGSPYGSRAPCDDIPQNYVAVGIASEEPGILAPKPYGVNLGTMTSEDVCWLRRWFGLNGRHYLVEEWHAELSFRRADSLLSLAKFPYSTNHLRPPTQALASLSSEYLLPQRTTT